MLQKVKAQLDLAFPGILFLLCVLVSDYLYMQVNNLLLVFCVAMTNSNYGILPI